MAWCRAVWLENEVEEDGVVPTCWVDNSVVYWPNKNALSAARNLTPPDETWLKFPMLKIKIADGEI